MWNTPINDTTKLTLELRDLVESGVKIWDFEYPSYYKGAEKIAFEQKVIDHYYFRQIGQETTGRFLHYFRTRIREIMPYYIQMYKSVEVMEGVENPFDNVDIIETYEEERSSTSSGSSSAQSSGSSTAQSSGSSTASRDTTEQHSENLLDEFSDTPQGDINNLGDHLTEGRRNTNSRNATSGAEETGSNEHESSAESTGSNSSISEGSETGTVRHTFTKKGNQGVNTYAHDIIEFRKSLINVDMMVIEALSDLFLKVY